MTTPTTTDTGERRLLWVPLDELQPATDNPKAHDLDSIVASIREFGYVTPGLRDERTGRLVAGHGRAEALKQMRAAGEPAPDGVRCDNDGAWLVPVVTGWSSVDDGHAAAYLVIDNHHPTLGGWDEPGLADLLAGLDTDLLDVVGVDLDALLAAGDPQPQEPPRPAKAALTDRDAIPDGPDDLDAGDAHAITRLGDVWQLGRHRIICGDTTDPAVLARLLDGLPPATLIHADPPYGMGKQSDGVLNDNLYGPKLDAFQAAWWTAWRTHWADNGSAYIWGNAPDLWRWWWGASPALGADPTLLLRNELVWDKGSIPGMRSPGAHSYPIATERCLFLMRGEQFLGDQNQDAFFEGYEPLRAHLAAERDRAGWTNGDVNRITGTKMAGHWMSRSQFQPIGRAPYQALQAAAAGRAFVAGYDELFGTLFPHARGDGNQHRRELSAAMREGRSHFDNTHAAMTDVWQFGRVVGEERHGHATPKPVAMVERALLSSSRPGDVVAAPFAGTGPEFIAGHHLDRVVVAAELHPAYVDVVCARYQAHTGTHPHRLDGDQAGVPVDFLR